MEPNVFVTSDPHYFHKNIAGPKVSAWKAGYRDFDDEQQMSQHIVKVWNKTVAENDILYVIGDWAFGGIQNIWNFRKQLRCKNIHIILGNHDHHIEANKILPNVCNVGGFRKEPIFFDGNYPGDGIGHSLVTAKEIFTSVQHVLTVKLAGRTFFMSHYAHRVWEGSHKGILHLYAHSHGSIPDYGKSMDVGVDVAKRLLGDYVPFPLEYIINHLDKREIEFPDHHDINTNIK